jgi:hypothetical protein
MPGTPLYIPHRPDRHGPETEREYLERIALLREHELRQERRARRHAHLRRMVYLAPGPRRRHAPKR